MAMLLDEGWETLELVRTPVDPLRFRDVKKYGERLKEAQAKTGRPEALEYRERHDGRPAGDCCRHGF